MRSKIVAALAILLNAAIAFAASGPSFKPKSGFVPDERTATAIAVAVWTPVFGEANIAAEKPYVARLIDGVWHVDGSLPKDAVGGAAHVEIAKGDGRIIAMWHEQ